MYSLHCACICLYMYIVLVICTSFENKSTYIVVLILYYSELFGSANTGINFDKYEEVKVEATGHDCPKNIENFSDMKFSPIIQENIKVPYVCSVGLFVINGYILVGSVFKAYTSSKAFNSYDNE